MRTSNQSSVTDIEVLEDFSSSAKCDEGFLRIRRLRCQNRRADGTASKVYRVDVVDRPRLDAVAVLVYRRTEAGLEVLTRMNLRPAAYFRLVLDTFAELSAPPRSQQSKERRQHGQYADRGRRLGT